MRTANKTFPLLLAFFPEKNFVCFLTVEQQGSRSFKSVMKSHTVNYNSDACIPRPSLFSSNRMLDHHPSEWTSEVLPKKMWNTTSRRIKARIAEALGVASATAHFTKKVATLWAAKSNRGGSVAATIFHAFSGTAEPRFSPLISTFADFFINQAPHKLEFYFHAPDKALKAYPLVIIFCFINQHKICMFHVNSVANALNKYSFRKFVCGYKLPVLETIGDLLQRVGLNLGLKRRRALLTVIMEI